MDEFPSPNLGLSLKFEMQRKDYALKVTSFRPLIWGYLWNGKFLTKHDELDSFRPLIWGYLWNKIAEEMTAKTYVFPSPNLGLSLKWQNVLTVSKAIKFPSPNLGLSLKSVSQENSAV